MPATPIRRRALTAVVAGALSLALLSGCTQTQKDATNYADSEEEFLKGCEAVAQSDARVDDSTEIADPEAYCQCVFDALSGDDGIPFDEFSQINSDLRDEGGPLPDDFVKAYDSCDPATKADG